MRHPSTGRRFFAFLTILSVAFTQACPAWALRQREPESGTPVHSGLEERLRAPSRSVVVPRAKTAPLAGSSEDQDLADQMTGSIYWTQTFPNDPSHWNPDQPLATEATTLEAIRRLGVLFERFESLLPENPNQWGLIMARLLSPGDQRLQKALEANAAQWDCPSCAAHLSGRRGAPSAASGEAFQKGLQFDDQLMRVLYAAETGQVRPPGPDGAAEHDLYRVHLLGKARGYESHTVDFKMGGARLIRRVVDFLHGSRDVTDVELSVVRRTPKGPMRHLLTFSKNAAGEVILLDRDQEFTLMIRGSELLFSGPTGDVRDLEEFLRGNGVPQRQTLVWSSLDRSSFESLPLLAGARVLNQRRLKTVMGCCGINTPFVTRRLAGLLAGLYAVYIQGPFRGPHGTGVARFTPLGAEVAKVAGLYGPWLERQVPNPLHFFPEVPPKGLTVPAWKQAQREGLQRAFGLQPIDFSGVTEDQFHAGEQGGAILSGTYGSDSAQEEIHFTPREILGPPSAVGEDRRAWYTRIRDRLGIPLFALGKFFLKKLQIYLKGNYPYAEPEVQKVIGSLREIKEAAAALDDKITTRLAGASLRAVVAPTEVAPLAAPSVSAVPARADVPQAAQRREDVAQKHTRLMERVAKFRERGVSIFFEEGLVADVYFNKLEYLLNNIHSSFDDYVAGRYDWGIKIIGENTRIGKNVVIEQNATIENSDLHDGALVAINVEVRGSTLHERAQIWRNARVKNSNIASQMVVYEGMQLDEVLVLPPRDQHNRLVATLGVIRSKQEEARQLKGGSLSPFFGDLLSSLRMEREYGIRETILKRVVLRGGEGILNVVLKEGVDPKEIATTAEFDVDLRSRETHGAIVLEGDSLHIGSRSKIGRGVRLSGTYLESDVVIGAGTYADNSYFSSNTTVVSPVLPTQEDEPTLSTVVTESDVVIIESSLSNYYIRQRARVEYVRAKALDNATFGHSRKLEVGNERSGIILHPFFMLPDFVDPAEWMHQKGELATFTPAIAKASVDAQADSEFMADRENFARDWRRKMEVIKSARGSAKGADFNGDWKIWQAKGVIGEDAVVRYAHLSDVYVGDSASVDGTSGPVTITDTTLKSSREASTRVGGRTTLAHFLAEQGVQVQESDLHDVVAFEHTHLTRINGEQLVYMPGSDFENQQHIRAMLSGVGHHPGLILAMILGDWSNVGAEATWENHEGFAPRSGAWFGRSTFVGGATATLFPFSSVLAPVLLIARGLKVGAQALAHPFSFLVPMRSEAPDRWRDKGYNELWPGAYLWRSFAAYAQRQHFKMRERSAQYPAQEHRFDRDESLFNPHNVLAMIQSRDELTLPPRAVRKLAAGLRSAVKVGDAVEVGKIVLPYLARRVDFSNWVFPGQPEKDPAAREYQAIRQYIQRAIEQGSASGVLSGINRALDPPLAQFLSAETREGFVTFRESLKQISVVAEQALREWDPEILVAAIGRKEWYVGSPHDKDEFRDYDGLGANVMSEEARVSGVSAMTRYAQWYLLQQLSQQTQRIVDEGGVSSWEEIRDLLQRPFFSNQTSVRNYVEARRKDNYAAATQEKMKLLAELREMKKGDPQRLLGLQNLPEEEEALETAVAWDFSLGQWKAQMNIPLGVQPWRENDKEQKRSDATRMEQALGQPWREVHHDISAWSRDDFNRHVQALQVMTDWLSSDAAYSGTDRWADAARPTLRTFWATEGVPNIKEGMGMALGNLEMFMDDALGQREPGLDRSATVVRQEERLGADGPRMIQQRRDELAGYLEKVSERSWTGDPGIPPANRELVILLPPDYSTDAVRNAFIKLEGTVFSAVWGARQYPDYGAALEPMVEEIFQRRGGKREGQESWMQAFQRQWEQEKQIPMAGLAFMTAVELIHRWAVEVGHLDRDLYQILQENRLDEARRFGWISDGLHQQLSQAGPTRPDLLGIYTVRTAELALLFYQWHARWAVFGGVSQYATQPFVSHDRIFFGAQNGVLGEGIYGLHRRVHVQHDGVRYASANDGEVLVNNAAVLFQRHAEGKLGTAPLTRHEQATWDAVDGFLRQQRHEEGRAAPGSSVWAKMAHDSEVAIWVSEIVLSSDESQFAVELESALDPLTHTVYAHNRRVYLVQRPDTGEYMLTSELTAALGLWTEKEREEASQRIWEAKAVRKQVVARAREETGLMQIVPEYESEVDGAAYLARLVGQKNSADSGTPLWNQLEAKVRVVQQFQAVVQQASDKYEAEVQPIKARFRYRATVVDGKGAMVRVRPAYDRAQGKFVFQVATMRADVVTEKETGKGGEEYSVVHLGPKGVRNFRESEAKRFEPEERFDILEGDLDPTAVGKGHFETVAEYATYEIGQEERVPGVKGGIFGRNWRDYKEQVTVKQNDPSYMLERLGENLERWQRLFIIGEGSSYFVGLLVKYVAKVLLPGIKVIVMRPSQALASHYFSQPTHPERLNPQTDLFLLLSWSGETDTVIKTAKELQKARYNPTDTLTGIVMIWIGGRVATTLAHMGRNSGGAIDVQTGEEVQVWATKNKAAMNQVTLLYLRDLARRRSRGSFVPGQVKYDQFQKHNEGLVKAAIAMTEQAMKGAIDNIGRWRGVLPVAPGEFRMGHINQFNVVGDSPARFEMTLKFLEGINRVGSYFSTDDPTYWSSVAADQLPGPDGRPMPWQNRSATIYLATSGTGVKTDAEALGYGALENRNAADRDLEFVRKHAYLGIPLIVVTTPEHPHVEAMRDLVGQIGLPRSFVIEIPKVANAFQPMVDEIFSFWLTAPIAKEHQLTPDEIDRPRGLAKSITISAVTALKLLLKSIRKNLVTVDSMIRRAVGAAPPSRYKEDVLDPKRDEENPAAWQLYEVPLAYQRLMEGLRSSEKGTEGLNITNLQDTFGKRLERLKNVVMLTDSDSNGVPLSLELPLAELLRVGSDTVSATEPIAEPLYRLPDYQHNPELVIVMASEDSEERIAEKVRAFKARGDIVITLSPDNALTAHSADSGGTLTVVQEQLKPFQHHPIFQGPLYVGAMRLVLHLAKLRAWNRNENRPWNEEENRLVEEHWKAMETLPAYAAQILTDRSRINKVQQFAKTLVEKTAKDSIDRTLLYRKYNNGMIVGGRQGRAGADAGARIFRRYGFKMEVEDLETSKHGPLAVAPDGFILVVNTDKTQLDIGFSDAQIYSTNLADIWMVMQQGDDRNAGLISSGTQGVVTTAVLHEYYGLPMEVLVFEMMGQAYAKEWKRNRADIDESLEELRYVGQGMPSYQARSELSAGLNHAVERLPRPVRAAARALTAQSLGESIRTRTVVPNALSTGRRDGSPQTVLTVAVPGAPLESAVALVVSQYTRIDAETTRSVTVNGHTLFWFEVIDPVSKFTTPATGGSRPGVNLLAQIAEAIPMFSAAGLESAPLSESAARRVVLELFDREMVGYESNASKLREAAPADLAPLLLKTFGNKFRPTLVAGDGKAVRDLKSLLVSHASALRSMAQVHPNHAVVLTSMAMTLSSILPALNQLVAALQTAGQGAVSAPVPDDFLSESGLREYVVNRLGGAGLGNLYQWNVEVSGTGKPKAVVLEDQREIGRHSVAVVIALDRGGLMRDVGAAVHQAKFSIGKEMGGDFTPPALQIQGEKTSWFVLDFDVPRKNLLDARLEEEIQDKLIPRPLSLAKPDPTAVGFQAVLDTELNTLYPEGGEQLNLIRKDATAALGVYQASGEKRQEQVLVRAHPSGDPHRSVVIVIAPHRPQIELNVLAPLSHEVPGIQFNREVGRKVIGDSVELIIIDVENRGPEAVGTAVPKIHQVIRGAVRPLQFTAQFEVPYEAHAPGTMWAAVFDEIRRIQEDPETPDHALASTYVPDPQHQAAVAMLVREEPGLRESLDREIRGAITKGNLEIVRDADGKELVINEVYAGGLGQPNVIVLRYVVNAPYGVYNGGNDSRVLDLLSEVENLVAAGLEETVFTVDEALARIAALLFLDEREQAIESIKFNSMDGAVLETRPIPTRGADVTDFRGDILRLAGVSNVNRVTVDLEPDRSRAGGSRRIVVMPVMADVARSARSLQAQLGTLRIPAAAASTTATMVDLTVDETGRANPAAALMVPYLPAGTVAIVGSMDDVLTAEQLAGPNHFTQASVVEMGQNDLTTTLLRAVLKLPDGVRGVRILSGRTAAEIQSALSKLEGGIAPPITIVAPSALGAMLGALGVDEGTRTAFLTLFQRARDNWDGLVEYL